MPSLPNYIKRNEKYMHSSMKNKGIFWSHIYDFVMYCYSMNPNIDPKAAITDELLDLDWEAYENPNSFIEAIGSYYAEEAPSLATCARIKSTEEEMAEREQEEWDARLEDDRTHVVAELVARWHAERDVFERRKIAKLILDSPKYSEIILSLFNGSISEFDWYGEDLGISGEELKRYFVEFYDTYQAALEAYPYLSERLREIRQIDTRVKKREEKILKKAGSEIEDKIREIESKLDAFEQALRSRGTDEQTIEKIKEGIIGTLEGADVLSDIENKLEQIKEKEALPVMSESTFMELMDTLPASTIENIINTGEYLGATLTKDQIIRAVDVLREKESIRGGMENFMEAAKDELPFSIDIEDIKREMSGERYGEQISIVVGEDQYFQRMYSTIDGNTASVLSSITGVPAKNITASPYRVEISHLSRLDELIDNALKESIKRGLSTRDMDFLSRLRDFVDEHYDELYPPDLLTLTEAASVGMAAIRDAPEMILVRKGLEAYIDESESHSVFYIRDTRTGRYLSLRMQESYIAAATAGESKLDEDTWEFSEWFERLYHGDIEKGMVAIIALSLYGVPHAAYHIIWHGLKDYLDNNPQTIANLMKGRGVEFALSMKNIDFMGETIARTVFHVEKWPGKRDKEWGKGHE